MRPGDYLALFIPLMAGIVCIVRLDELRVQVEKMQHILEEVE